MERLCEKCHVLFVGRVCKPCDKAYHAAYYLANKAKHQARSAEYYKVHSEEVKAQAKTWAMENRERRLEIIRKSHRTRAVVESVYSAKYRREHVLEEQIRHAIYCRAHPYDPEKDGVRQRTARLRDPEKFNARHRRYLASHPKVREANLLRAKLWFQQNPDRARETKKRYRVRKRDQFLRYSKQWKAKNADKVKEAARRYAAANRDKILIHTHNRRTRIRGGGGNLSASAFRLICGSQNGKCFDCGNEPPSKPTGRPSLEIGHLVPVIRGGSSDPINIIGQCRRCNREQGTRIHAEAYQRDLA
jgi:hypothetical protein